MDSKNGSYDLGRVQQLTGYVEDRLPAIAAILFYWIRMKVVQQLTCLTLGSPNGPAYSTGELLNTPLGSLSGEGVPRRGKTR